MTMFKKTDLNPQLDIFTAPSMQLGSRASKKYSDPNTWHNQFYSFVTTKIDEEIFKPLFPEGKKCGRPNASIRILVAMSVLKEGFGCSDEELFEKCEFDLLTRKALGMELLTDVTPSIDTYYLFLRRICEYQERTGIDLMQLCFEQLAGNQVSLLKISGKCVRMDSKLIGSNIARQSRYKLIYTTLVKFFKTCTLSNLSPEQEERAKEYLKEYSCKYSNSYFGGSPESGVCFARLMFHFTNIRKHNLDPVEYLCDVFRRSKKTAKDKLVDLLAHRWQKATDTA